MGQLDNKIAIVTGAAGGFGEGIRCIRGPAEGAKRHVHYIAVQRREYAPRRQRSRRRQRAKIVSLIFQGWRSWTKLAKP